VLAPTWTLFLYRKKTTKCLAHPLKVAWFMCCYMTMKCCVILNHCQNMTVYSVCPCCIIQMLLSKCCSFLPNFKLSPCLECCLLSWLFSSVCSLNANVSERTVPSSLASGYEVWLQLRKWGIVCVSLFTYYTPLSQMPTFRNTLSVPSSEASMYEVWLW
jgi:hypothetical protein